MKPDSAGAIGVFDSGVGGLTVLRRIEGLLPNERLLYVADQAHVPYGGRDLAEVRSFACAISDALVDRGCKAIVMGCNISSATALDAVKARYPGFPVVGVIEPGAVTAANVSRNRRIGVLATDGTVRSGAYTRCLRQLDADIEVTEVSCPKFVPLVEHSQHDSEEASEAAREYMASLNKASADTVILGCTHYPFLLPALRRAGPGITFVDPADAASSELASLLACHEIAAGSELIGQSVLYTTGALAAFETQATHFLNGGRANREFCTARWNGTELRID